MHRYELTCIPAVIQIIYSRLRFRLPLVASVHVANEVVAYIVADLRHIVSCVAMRLQKKQTYV